MENKRLLVRVNPIGIKGKMNEKKVKIFNIKEKDIKKVGEGGRTAGSRRRNNSRQRGACEAGVGAAAGERGGGNALIWSILGGRSREGIVFNIKQVGGRRGESRVS